MVEVGLIEAEIKTHEDIYIITYRNTMTFIVFMHQEQYWIESEHCLFFIVIIKILNQQKKT